MNMEPEHSHLVGGSSAEARINCPASYSMEMKLPEAAREKTSTYADEGSACHAAIAHILNNGCENDEDVIGMAFPKFEAFPITRELYDEAIRPCLDFFDKLDAEVVGGLDYHIEKKVRISAIPGALGTVDVLGRCSQWSVVGDWKLGVGVGVYAWYTNENTGAVEYNDQLMFYVLGALETYPEMFDLDPNWPIKIFIGQPRYRDDPHFDMVTVTRSDVIAFQQRLGQAILAAGDDNPPMAKGPWCRFRPCKSICPLHTGPLFDLTEMEQALTRVQLEAAVDGGDGGGAAIDWGATYARMLQLANAVEPVVAEWRKQAHAFLEEGGAVPGWKLVNKRATRKWAKPDRSVDRKLGRMGLDVNQRRPRTLISAPQAEKLLKTLGKKLPEGFYEAVSSGLTLAQADDKRQPAEPVRDVIASLATALSALSGEKTKNED